MCTIRWCAKNRAKLVKLVDQYRKEASAGGSCAPTQDAFDRVAEETGETFGNKISCGSVATLYYEFRRGNTTYTRKKRVGTEYIVIKSEKKNTPTTPSLELKFDLLLATLSLSVPPVTKVDLFHEIMQM